MSDPIAVRTIDGASATMRELPRIPAHAHEPTIVLLRDPPTVERPAWVIALPRDHDCGYEWFEISDTSALALVMMAKYR